MLTINGIGLIKLVRCITDCGLVTAKDLVCYYLSKYLGIDNPRLSTDYVLSASDVIVLLRLAVNVTSEKANWVMSPSGQVVDAQPVGYSKLNELLNGLSITD